MVTSPTSIVTPLSSSVLPHTLKDFVLDTNILLNDPNSLYNFEDNNIVIPMTVLEELDKIKEGRSPHHALVSRDARVVIHIIATIINGASTEDVNEGVPIGEHHGNLRILNDFSLSLTKSSQLPQGVPDNRIIESVLYLQEKKAALEKEAPQEQIATPCLLSRDINLRLKAKSAGVLFAEDYRSDKVLDDLSFMDSGYVEVPDNFTCDFNEVETVYCDNSNKIIVGFDEIESELFNKLTVKKYLFNDFNVWQVNEIDKTNKKITLKCMKRDTLNRKKVFGISPINIQQSFAIDALMDKEIDCVILSGVAGSGKSLLALSAGLTQVIEQGVYDRIIVMRSTPDLAEALGFLPGDEEDKIKPFLGSIMDSLEFLVKGDKGGSGEGKPNLSDSFSASVNYLIERADIQFKSLNTMRGRSLIDSYIILDESQNLTTHQMKSILSRVGKNSKITVLGNLNQIDDNRVNAYSSGLLAAVEKLKHFNRGVNVVLQGTERSLLAGFVEENM